MKGLSLFIEHSLCNLFGRFWSQAIRVMSVLWEAETYTVNGQVNVDSVVKQTGEYGLFYNSASNF